MKLQPLNFGLGKFASLANKVLLGVTRVRDMDRALIIGLGLWVPWVTLHQSRSELVEQNLTHLQLIALPSYIKAAYISTIHANPQICKWK